MPRTNYHKKLGGTIDRRPFCASLRFRGLEENKKGRKVNFGQGVRTGLCSIHLHKHEKMRPDNVNHHQGASLSRHILCSFEVNHQPWYPSPRQCLSRTFQRYTRWDNALCGRNTFNMIVTTNKLLAPPISSSIAVSLMKTPPTPAWYRFFMAIADKRNVAIPARTKCLRSRSDFTCIDKRTPSKIFPASSHFSHHNLIRRWHVTIESKFM